ncbi:outer membrane beta-barrel family protein [Jiulongibacter sediminis]|uniref:TonB-dependent receptor n=1 Tax=Jiulongibacter sediminis TaxID=1605367 RepID=A0A0P7BTR5_9BACT|nr:outer membrane beta-barrel family protein [Jiulongibacter sediminis]KPM47999.1 TonB-dependent receptor [Jiulongibacter sediminis]TBX24181.1 TonB-dependent receptor [Jiulongibacter sediminis]
MKKPIVALLFILIGFSLTVNAQRPGGPPSGDGNGRPSRPGQSTPPSFDMDAGTPKGNSKITGFVIDSAVTIAVEYANVALIDQESKKVIDGTMADGNGKFQFTRVAKGTYSLKVTFIGYEDALVENVKVEKGEDIDLGTVKLAISAKVLDEVTVTGLKSIIEEKVDRLVYNAENDVTSKGGDGTDVLRKVPMLAVDLDGNLSLRGSENIRVLINNKPSTIVASSVADALKMIPADLIKTVEVITSPSAKYDAEGTTGIVNIITKRSSVQGYNLNINTGVGVRGTNLGLNGNLRVGKVGFSLGGFGRAFYNKSATELNQTTMAEAGQFKTTQTADARDFGMFGRYNLGMDVEISKSEYITGNVSFGTRNMNRDQDMLISNFTNDVLNRETNRLLDTKNSSNNVDVNLDYVKIFKPTHEWSVSTQYSQNNMVNNFDASNFTLSGESLGEQQNLNASINKEITVQTDYMMPIGQRQMFETGVKGIFREVNSDFEYLAGFGGSLEADARNPAGFLNYNQNVQAGYLSYTYTTPSKWSFKAGARYERTTIDADDSGVILDINGYDNLVPSVNISKIMKNGLAVKLAYNNRIQRPGLQQLNPNFNAANPQSIEIGNPNLEPEISNNVELGLSKSIKRNYVNLSFYARQTNNSILRLTSPSDTLAGALVTTYENIGKEQTSGLNLFGNFFLTPKWSLNGGFDLYYTYMEGQVQTLDGFEVASNNGIVIGGRMMSQISLNKGWAVQAFGGMRGNQVTLQGQRTGFGFYSLGLRKDINEKKGSLGFAFDNFLGGMTMRSTSVSPLFSQESINYIYNQNVKVTFQYKLGNMKFVAKKKTRSVNNTDGVGGGDDNPAQGGGFNR